MRRPPLLGQAIVAGIVLALVPQSPPRQVDKAPARAVATAPSSGPSVKLEQRGRTVVVTIEPGDSEPAVKPDTPDEPDEPDGPTEPVGTAEEILRARCFDCHQLGKDPKGKIILFAEDGSLHELGPLDAMRIDNSIYAQRSPPDKPLTDDEYASVRVWIQKGYAKFADDMRKKRANGAEPR